MTRPRSNIAQVLHNAQQRFLSVAANAERTPERLEVRNEAGSDAATIYFYGVVGSYWDGLSAGDIATQLRDLDVTELEVRIHSPGGAAWDGIAIMNALRNHKARVRVVIDGIAASAASVIAMAGDEIVMMPGSQLMIHDAWMVTVGNAAELAVDADFLDKQSQNVADIYAARTGATAEAMRAAMRAETWYTPTEAITAGLADRVAEAPAAESGAQNRIDWDLSMFTYPGRDKAPGPAAAHTGTAPQPPSASAVGSTTTQETESAVAFSDEQMKTMRQELGLAEDADEATIVAALSEALAEAAEETTSPTQGAPAATTTVPEGMQLIETEVLDTLRAGAVAGSAARDQQLAEHRDRVIAAAIADGKTTPARKDHWVQSWAADPEGTEATLNALAPGLVPVTERGHDQQPVNGTSAYDELYAPKEA